MTTIVGFLEPGVGVWIGADTRATEGNYIAQAQIGKIVRLNGFMIGCCGDLRTMNVLASMRSRPASIGALVESMRGALTKSGYIAHTAAGAPDFDQGFLVATKRGLWEVDSAFGFNEAPRKTLVSAGSGSAVALGAGFAMRGKPGKDTCTVALNAAAALDNMTGAPFQLHCIPW